MNTTRQQEVPHEFWEALQQLRKYLLRDATFTYLIYESMPRRTDLQRSFDIVDNWLKVYLEENGF